MPSNAGAWIASTATGVLRDVVGEKWTQLGLGTRGDAKGLRRGDRLRAERGTKCWGGVTSPASVGVFDLGSFVDGGAPDRERRRGTGACEGNPTTKPVLDRAAGMGNRTERQSTPTEGSRLRGGVRRAELNPSTASRSGNALIPVGLAVRRAALNPRRPFRVWDGPSRFLRLETLAKSRNMNPVSPMRGALATETGPIAGFTA